MKVMRSELGLTTDGTVVRKEGREDEESEKEDE